MDYLDVEDLDEETDLDLNTIDSTADLDTKPNKAMKPKTKSGKRKSIDENQMVPQTDRMTETVKVSMSLHNNKKVKIPSITIKESLIVIKGFSCKLCKFLSTDKVLMKFHRQENHIKEPTAHAEELQIQLLKNVLETKQIENKAYSSGPKLNSKQTLSRVHNHEMLPTNTHSCPTSENKQSSSECNVEVIDHILEHNQKSDKVKDLSVVNLSIKPAFKDVEYVPRGVLSGPVESMSQVTFVDGIACWFCKTPFDNVMQMNSHINKVHYLKQEVQPLEAKDKLNLEVLDSKTYCFTCSKQYMYARSLNEHNLQKHAEKHLPCDQCERMFSRQSYLDKHVRERHTLVNLKCRFCKKIFASIRTLKPHLRVVHEYQMQKNEEHLFVSQDQEEYEGVTKSQQDPIENNICLTGNTKKKFRF